MRARLVVISALALATAASAEPPKKAAETAQPSTHPAVILASADQAVSDAPADQSVPAPAKRPRAARVTSCRCGDPQSQPEQP